MVEDVYNPVPVLYQNYQFRVGGGTRQEATAAALSTACVAGFESASRSNRSLWKTRKFLWKWWQHPGQTGGLTRMGGRRGGPADIARMSGTSDLVAHQI